MRNRESRKQFTLHETGSTPDSALAGRYRRLVQRRGHKKAIVAVAHKILTTAYLGSCRALLLGLLRDDVAVGTPGGSSLTAGRMNDRGQVIGSSTTASGDTHAFLWERGVMTDLGTLGESHSSAVDINERGQVIGFGFSGEFPDSTSRAFLWRRGVMIDLGTPPGSQSVPMDINERGQVVGWWSPTPFSRNSHAFSGTTASSPTWAPSVGRVPSPRSDQQPRAGRRC